MQNPSPNQSYNQVRKRDNKPVNKQIIVVKMFISLDTLSDFSFIRQ